MTSFDSSLFPEAPIDSLQVQGMLLHTHALSTDLY